MTKPRTKPPRRPREGADFYMRNPRAVVITVGNRVLVDVPGAEPLEFNDVDAVHVSRFLRQLALPTPGEALEDDVDRDVLSLLLDTKVLLHANAKAELDRWLPTIVPEAQKPCGRLVVGICGCTQAVLLGPWVYQLYHGFARQLDVVFTESAASFVNPEGYTHLGIETWTDAFEVRGKVNVPHIHLASAADLVLILGASAHTLHKLASGACSDLLSLVVAATTAPVVVAPTMNSAMWDQPAVRRNVDQLRQDGLYIVEPSLGVEASRRELAQPEFGPLGLRADQLVGTLTMVLAGSATT